MVVRFLEIAQIELDEAIEFYNSESTGLGDEFLLEVLNALDRIQWYPEAWQIFTKNTRRCQTRKFPYAVVYQVLKNEIIVVAIAHLHRNPDYWKDRIKGN
jgi:hypothetical protein